MNRGTSWPHWLGLAVAASGGAVAAGPAAAWRRRATQASGLALVGLLSLAAQWVQNAPLLLPPAWLSVGAATALAVRWPSWRMLLALGGAMLLAAQAGTVLQAPGAQIASLWHGLGESAVSALQAGITAQAMRQLWASLQDDHHQLNRVRLVHLIRLLFVVMLPRALLAGALMTALHAWGSLAVVDEGGLPWRLGLVYAAASGLSILVLSPLLWLGRMGAGGWTIAGVLATASVFVTLPGLHAGMGLYAMPLLALAAGYLGGLGLAAVCCTLMLAGQMMAMHHHEMPPFEGPDGFIVQLLFSYRLVATAYLASAWADRRARRLPARTKGRGATVHLHLQDLASAWAAAPTAAPSALLLVRWPDSEASADLGAGSGIPARNSQALTAIAQRLASTLRGGDAIGHFGSDGLLVALANLPAKDVPAVCARVAAKVRGLRAEATASVFAMDRAALALCLQTAAMLEAEAAGPERAPAAGSGQAEQGPAVDAPHHGA